MVYAHVEDIPVQPCQNKVVQPSLELMRLVGPDHQARRRYGLPSLFTCSISAELDGEHSQVFCAMLARDVAEVRSRVRQRYGLLLESEARVTLGFDWSEPLACAMVSDAMADVLGQAAEDPLCAIAAGLDFHIEQRFTS